MTLQVYAEKKIAELEKRVETEAVKTLGNGHAEAIHDLRVSIRRFSQALRAFEQVIGKRRAKRVRRSLRVWMDAAAEIRNRDIAIELLSAAGVEEQSAVTERLKKGRAAAQDRLTLLLSRRDQA